MEVSIIFPYDSVNYIFKSTRNVNAFAAGPDEYTRFWVCCYLPALINQMAWDHAGNGRWSAGQCIECRRLLIAHKGEDGSGKHH